MTTLAGPSLTAQQRLKLARHREVPLLKLLGWEVCGDWSASFVLMQFVSRETEAVDLRRLAA